MISFLGKFRFSILGNLGYMRPCLRASRLLAEVRQIFLNFLRQAERLALKEKEFQGTNILLAC